MTRSHQRGFTAIEVLVSLTLGLVIIGLCTSAFSQTVKTVRRSQIRLAMHETANSAYTALVADLQASYETTAFFAESTADTGIGDGVINLVFMRGQFDPKEFTSNLDSGRYVMTVSDDIWVMWRFDQRMHTISRATSTSFREFKLDQAWISPNGNNFNNRRFTSMPQPQRSATTNARLTLDTNHFQTGHVSDVGDYTDLEQHLVPLVTNVETCDLSLVLADGTQRALDVNSDQVIALDGAYIDGALRGVLPHRIRPTLLCIRFTIRDQGSDIEQAFSFSLPITEMQPWALP